MLRYEGVRDGKTQPVKLEAAHVWHAHPSIIWALNNFEVPQRDIFGKGTSTKVDREQQMEY